MRSTDSGTGAARVRLVADGHRVTMFELFFDLVFVFAVTQVTAYIAHSHDGTGLVQATLLLGLTWWSWSGYAWLGNQAHADVGVLRIGLVVAMIAIFVCALATPEAWHDMPGGLDGPLVLACAYAVVRTVHTVLYLVAAGDDAGLHHQVLVNIGPTGAGVALLLVGALVGGTGQTVLWAGALAVDWTGTYLTSRHGGGWRLHSVAHWVERHGLVVILALGESIVAIGTGAAERPVSWSLLGGAILGILVATALWWLYFDLSAEAAERALARLEGGDRVHAAVMAYTYSHFPAILGIVVTAFGIEDALAHAGDGEAFGAFAAGALCLGPALYLLGLAAVWMTLDREVKGARLVTAAVLVLAWPLVGELVPLAALTAVLGVLGVLVLFETRRYADLRAELAAARA